MQQRHMYVEFYDIRACALYNHIYLNSVLASRVDRLISDFFYTLLHELIDIGLLHFMHVCTIYLTTTCV